MVLRSVRTKYLTVTKLKKHNKMASKTLILITLGICIGSITAVNNCKVGQCASCIGVTGIDDKSCILCGHGVAKLVSADKPLECDLSGVPSNCARWTPTTKCSACSTDFYPSADNSSCSAVTTKIENCMYYLATQDCGICNKGYFP